MNPNEQLPTHTGNDGGDQQSYNLGHTNKRNATITMIGDPNLLNQISTNSTDGAGQQVSATMNRNPQSQSHPHSNSYPSTNDLDSQPQRDVVETLQAQLQELQEANFDLQATLATMQAEQAFSIQQIESKYKEETTKLQNSLRLEQQMAQRLLQQNKRPRTELDTFQRRLPTAAMEEDASSTSLQPLPEFTTGQQSTSTTAATKAAPPSPLEATTTMPLASPHTKSTDHPQRPNSAIVLARKLLYHVPSQSSLDIHNFLIQVATNDYGIWNECLLVEFLIRQSNALVYWQEALLCSRPARQGILHAMQQLETNVNTKTNGDNDFPVSRRHHPRCRIHKLNPDGSTGKQLLHNPTNFTMNAEIVRDWVGNRLDRHNPEHLQLLALVLEDSPSHATNIWWTILLPGMTSQLIHLHAQINKPKIEQQSTNDFRRTPNKRWSDIGPSRRFRFQTVSTFQMIQETDILLLACMTLMEQLVSATRFETLQSWYDFTQTPKQPIVMEDLADASDESALLWVGLLLDILEGLECFQYDKPLELPGWYLQWISLMATIGRTSWGMKVLRTRLPDSAGGDVRPNVLDTAITQLFQLSLMDAHDVVDYLDAGHRQRLLVMGFWVRLIHQALLFVQQQEKPEISFRSLVLDLYDYYTSACTRILTDRFVQPEIQSMIRLQLDELALDEEEHDDWKE